MPYRACVRHSSAERRPSVLGSRLASGTAQSWNTNSEVTEELLAFREEVGQFGTLLVAGKDWADPDLARMNMKLLAEEVKPAINAAEAASSKAAQ